MSVTLSALTLLLDWDRLIDVESGIKYVLTTKTTTSSSSIIGVGTKSQRKRERNRKKGKKDRQMNREKETALHESKSLHNFKVRRRSVNNRRLNWANEKKGNLIWIWKPVCHYFIEKTCSELFFEVSYISMKHNIWIIGN